MFLGGPIIGTLFQLPGRFQLVYGLSGLDAGARLIPFSLAVPAGTGMASGLASRFRTPLVYLILGGSCIQIVGFAVLGTLPESLTLPTRMYAGQIIAGLGCGINFTPLFLSIPVTVGPRDTGKPYSHLT